MIKQYFTQAWAQLRQQPGDQCRQYSRYCACHLPHHVGGDDAASEGGSVCPRK